MKKILGVGILITMLASCGSQVLPVGAAEPVHTTTPSDDTLLTLNTIWTMPEKDFVKSFSLFRERLATSPDMSPEQQDKVFEEILASNDQLAPQQALPTVPEALACGLVGVAQCAWARYDSITAVWNASKIFHWQTQQDKNERNAFQHSFWNGLMTKHITATAAEMIATAHERGSASYGNPVSNMDMFNNAVGRRIAGANKFMSDTDLASRLVWEMKQGNLQIMDRNNSERVIVKSNKYLSTWAPINSINLVYPEWSDIVK